MLPRTTLSSPELRSTDGSYSTDSQTICPADSSHDGIPSLRKTMSSSLIGHIAGPKLADFFAPCLVQENRQHVSAFEPLDSAPQSHKRAQMTIEVTT
jgi:hypothetical protein